MKIQEIIGWNNLKLDRRRTGVRQDNAVRFFAIINPIRTGGVGGGGVGEALTNSAERWYLLKY